MKFGIVVFPGSNGEADCFYAIKQVLKEEAELIWHQQAQLPPVDALILPGGFAYGDYNRSGIIARFSAILPEIISFAHQGGLVLGISHGFQILTEAELLPGALLRNIDLKFICSEVNIKVEHNNSPFTCGLEKNQVLTIPIAHGEGNYFCDPDTLAGLQQENRIVFSYCGPAGEVGSQHNPNGSLAGIAGISNRAGNVLGMMPHPERAAEAILGGTHGLGILHSMSTWIREGRKK
jgi:phosphoribosylformylglycinamidine synthase